jgi:heat shock protein HtpX
MNGTTLVKHRAKNIFHTVVLLVAMAGVLALLGWLLAGTTGLAIAAIFGALSMLFSPNLSPRLIFRLYRARPLDRRQAPVAHRIVEQLAERAGLGYTPQVYYIPSRLLNAITVGQKEEAAIGVTDGVLRGLDAREFAGVVAHEIAHIANNDTRVMGMADLIGRITSMMSSFGKILLLINLPLVVSGAVTIPWSIVLVLLLAPMLSGLLQLALSRTREFDADLNAVRLTGDPQGLARALEKLEHYNESFVKHLLMPGYRQSEPSLLRTHPHTEARLERLEELTDQEIPDRERLDRGVRASDEMEAGRQVDRVEGPPKQRPFGLWY